MFEKIIAITNQTEMELVVGGDLMLNAIDGNEIAIRTDREKFLTTEEKGDRVIISCEVDCIISAPANLGVLIIQVSGDATIRGVTGGLEIRQVGGDLTVSGTPDTHIGLVGGSVQAVEINGSLALDRAGGDFNGVDISGSLAVSSIGGDLQLMRISGGAAGKAGGDIRVRIENAESQSLSMKAGGDIQLSLPEGAGFSLHAVSGGRGVKVDMNGGHEKYEQKIVSLIQGNANLNLELEAGGDISIRDNLSDAPDFTDTVDAQARWEEKITRKTERAMRKAEEKLQRARERADMASVRARVQMQRAEERVAAARRKLELHQREQESFGPAFAGVERTTTRAASGGATEEEKRLILTLLQEKKITVDEANRLFESLEGGED